MEQRRSARQHLDRSDSRVTKEQKMQKCSRFGQCGQTMSRDIVKRWPGAAAETLPGGTSGGFNGGEPLFLRGTFALLQGTASDLQTRWRVFPLKYKHPFDISGVPIPPNNIGAGHVGPRDWAMLAPADWANSRGIWCCQPHRANEPNTQKKKRGGPCWRPTWTPPLARLGGQ